jgi:hypothetical protein
VLNCWGKGCYRQEFPPVDISRRSDRLVRRRNRRVICPPTYTFRVATIRNLSNPTLQCGGFGGPLQEPAAAGSGAIVRRNGRRGPANAGRSLDAILTQRRHNRYPTAVKWARMVR